MALGAPGALSLADGEHLVWQASPTWRSFARRLYRLHWIALYGVVLMVADAIQARSAGFGRLATAETLLPGLLLTAGALLVFTLLAIGSARTTRYTLTDRRLVMQCGLALPATLSIPLHRIAGVAVRLHEDGSGDITVRPRERGKLTFLKLFPFARPWRFNLPEPMLRDAPAAGYAASLLTRLVAAANCPSEPAAAARQTVAA